VQIIRHLQFQYILANTRISAGVEMNILLIKTDLNNNIIWQKTYGGSLDDYARSISLINDKLFICGATYTSDRARDFYLVSTDLEGNINFEKRMEGLWMMYAMALLILETPFII
jgi:hypothetical protein